MPDEKNQSGKQTQDTKSRITHILKNAFALLSKGDFESADAYFERVLDINPKSCMAYIGKLMIERGVKVHTELANCDTPFDNSVNYQRAVRYGDEKAKALLNGYNDKIKARIQEAKREEFEAIKEKSKEKLIAASAAVQEAVQFGSEKAKVLFGEYSGKIKAQIQETKHGAWKENKLLIASAAAAVVLIAVMAAFFIFDFTAPKDIFDVIAPKENLEDFYASLPKYGFSQNAADAIKSGVNVNLKNKAGMTALMFAAKEGYTEAVKALIKKGADVNLKNQGGQTALMWAAEREDPELVNILIKAGADVNARDKDGKTALNYAANRLRGKNVNALMKAGAVNNIGFTNLMEAALNGTAKEINALIKKGADIEAKDGNGITVLMWAAGNGNAEAVNALIKAGADVNAWGGLFDNMTALMYAAAYGNVEVVNILIKAGAYVKAASMDGFGVTVLMWAAEHGNGNGEAINALIKAGADVNAWGGLLDMTALMYAAEKGNAEAVNALIDAGAYVKARDRFGRDAVYYARDNEKLKGTDALKRLEQLSR